jgi:cardiolipin synthase
MLNLPNFLTLIRILTIPFFLVYLTYHRYGEALIIFVIGGVTDFLDGLTARLMNQKTPLGAYLDPVADKLLVITSFVMLSSIGGVPMWLAVVVVSRDIFILLGYGIIYLLVEERLQIKPTRLGKFCTLLQLLTVGVALLLLHDPAILDPLIRGLLIGVTALVTVASGLQYLYRGLLRLQHKASAINF